MTCPLQAAQRRTRSDPSSSTERTVAVGVRARRQRRIVPGRRGLLPEIQHVVVVRMTAHAHRDELDERRSEARARAIRRPGKRCRHLVGVGAVDRDAGNAIAARLVGEDASRRLRRQRRRERNLVVLDAEDRRQPSGGAEVDRFVPLAERRSAVADERHRDALRSFARRTRARCRQSTSC